MAEKTYRPTLEPPTPQARPPQRPHTPTAVTRATQTDHDFSRIAVLPPNIQAKKTVNTPGDTYEQEADAVADRVLRMADPTVPSAVMERSEAEETSGKNAGPERTPGIKSFPRTPAAGPITPLVQRASAPLEAIAEPAAPEMEQGQSEEAAPIQAEAVQRKESGASGPGKPDVSPTVAAGVAGGGQALDGATRAFMEPRFGHDFSQVRIHTDSRASQSAQAVSARAYTTGRDIVFRSGEYAPGSDQGQRLLAHELTHVVQQGAAGKSVSPAASVQRTPLRSTGENATPAEAVPQSDQGITIGAGPEGEVQRAVVTNGGTFDTDTYAVAGGANFGGADIVLKFTPNDLVEANTIGLTQTNKRLASPGTSGGGAPTDPGPGFDGQPELRDRSVTTGDVGRIIDRVGFAPDPTTGGTSTLPTTNPMYGVHNTPANPSAGTPEHVSTSLTDTPPGGNATFGSHKRKPDGTFEAPKDAVLRDGPRVPIAYPGQMWQDFFETTALIMDGPMANTYLGSVKWGWKTDSAGASLLDPSTIQLVRAGAPTADFMAAAAKWNGLTPTDTTTGTTHATVPLPITSLDSGTVAASGMNTRDLLTRLTSVTTELTGLAAGADRTNKEFEKRALEAELARRNANVDVTVTKTYGRIFDDQVYIKMTGPGGGTSQTPTFKMGDGASHTFLAPLASVVPLTGTVHVEAWNHNMIESDDFILAKDWVPPYPNGTTFTAGNGRANYTLTLGL